MSTNYSTQFQTGYNIHHPRKSTRIAEKKKAILEATKKTATKKKVVKKATSLTEEDEKNIDNAVEEYFLNFLRELNPSFIITELPASQPTKRKRSN